jgi:hypothetical protein
MKALAVWLVIAIGAIGALGTTSVGVAAEGQNTAGQSGGFRGAAVFVPAPAPPPAPRPGSTTFRRGPLTPPHLPPPSFVARRFRGNPWLWPLMFYGGIGVDYFSDDSVAVFAPGEAPEGGLQLDVQPRRAAVYVDGVYAGTVGDFSGYYNHLSLTSGPHRIVILDRGFEPLSMDVVISPGRTSTYRGTLMRAYGQ